MDVIEGAISCERCHGPGSKHLARHEQPPVKGVRLEGQVDDTIVNPRHLSRDLAEAVCQQCHLRSVATISAPNTSLSAFRPGLPLQQFRRDYKRAGPEAEMTVVGHVEQLRASRCYQESATRSCLTCHNPHAANPDPDAQSHSQICLSCHKEESCRAPATLKVADNHCTRCHMPQSETEIPHLAFTHHRIAVHGKKVISTNPNRSEPASSDSKVAITSELIPVLDLSHLDEQERTRSLALAYVEAANRANDSASGNADLKRGLDLLLSLQTQGLRDPAVETALARLYFDLKLGDPLSLARQALEMKGLSSQNRCTALFIQAEGLVRLKRNREAVDFLKELTSLRYHSADWLLMADGLNALGQSPANSLERALRINPLLPGPHRFLADHYQKLGDTSRAEWHRLRIQQ